PDVIILDIKIPGKSGVEVLPELKTKSYAKVIMLTNYSDAYYKNLCMKLGAEYFLDKSNEFEKINEILMSIVPVE
ncbi:MAG TPA: response regulator, partial [Bacteroidia bacterium]|nr:response regulator [Bacteroidia bacterium]